MWIYAIYCFGAFNACQGVYQTESNPSLNTYGKYETYQQCKEAAIISAKQLAFEKTGKDIRWKCIDISNTKITEDK